MGKRINFLEYLKDIVKEIRKLSIQTPLGFHVETTWNDRFHVVSTWNPRGVFVGQKAVQSTDISLEIIKENADKFGSYLCELFSDCIDKGIFPNILKRKYYVCFQN